MAKHKSSSSAATALVEIACMTPLNAFIFSAAGNLMQGYVPPASSWAVYTQAGCFAVALAVGILGLSVQKSSEIGQGAGHWLLREATRVYCKATFLVAAVYVVLLFKALVVGDTGLDTGEEQVPYFLALASRNRLSSSPAAAQPATLSHQFAQERWNTSWAGQANQTLAVYLASPRQDWLDAALGNAGWQPLGTYDLKALNLTKAQRGNVSDVRYYGVPSTYVPLVQYIFTGSCAAYLLVSLMLAMYAAYACTPEGASDALFVDHGTLAIASVFLLQGLNQVVTSAYSDCAPLAGNLPGPWGLSFTACVINLFHCMSLDSLRILNSNAQLSDTRLRKKGQMAITITLGTVSFSLPAVPVILALSTFLPRDNSGDRVFFFMITFALIVLVLLLWVFLATRTSWGSRGRAALRLASVATPCMVSTAPFLLPVLFKQPASFSSFLVFEAPTLPLYPICIACAFARYWPWATRLLQSLPPPSIDVYAAVPVTVTPTAPALLYPGKDVPGYEETVNSDESKSVTAGVPIKGLFTIREQTFEKQRAHFNRQTLSNFAPAGRATGGFEDREPVPHMQGSRSLPPGAPPPMFSQYYKASPPLSNGDDSVFCLQNQALYHQQHAPAYPPMAAQARTAMIPVPPQGAWGHVAKTGRYTV